EPRLWPEAIDSLHHAGAFFGGHRPERTALDGLVDGPADRLRIEQVRRGLLRVKDLVKEFGRETGLVGNLEGGCQRNDGRGRDSGAYREIRGLGVGKCDARPGTEHRAKASGVLGEGTWLWFPAFAAGRLSLRGWLLRHAESPAIAARVFQLGLVARHRVG